MNIEDPEKKTSDSTYDPESEMDSVSDMDEKRRQHNRESMCFDPDNQPTKYNGAPIPSKIPVVEIDEKPSQTASYSWMS